MVEKCIEKLIPHKSLVTNLFLQWVQWASKKLICGRKTICFLYICFNLYKCSFLKCNWTRSNQHKSMKKMGERSWTQRCFCVMNLFKDHRLKDASVWWICSKIIDSNMLLCDEFVQRSQTQTCFCVMNLFKDHRLKDASVWWICSKMKTKVFLDFYCLQYTGVWNSRVKKPCWTAELRIMTS